MLDFPKLKTKPKAWFSSVNLFHHFVITYLSLYNQNINKLIKEKTT